MTVSPLANRPIRIHGLADARAAADAAQALGLTSLTLVAAGYGGASWLRGITARVATEHPSLAITAMLDCGDRPGEAQAALAAGMRHILFTGHPEAERRLSAIAAALGAIVPPALPPVFDPRNARDPRAACRSWLSSTSD